ncbi:hypothetical protein E2C01_093705 [Portunus trituberculatus]|uniref:Uncharacterized protein n=1 Tax=Portunus trituberculatus TaxID=210409 RepID=A0A5B7JU84_PORTR|nr:hypothetical protein [Portunus trituberculatus]
MIENSRPKVVEGRDGLGCRTGEGGGCRVRPEPKATGPFFPWWPQASLLVVHLQCLTLGKGRHKQKSLPLTRWCREGP